jgi:hypothetical protein
MPAEVLLMYGSKSASVFKTSAEALQEVLPRAMTLELSGLDHGSAQDYVHQTECGTNP